LKEKKSAREKERGGATLAWGEGEVHIFMGKVLITFEFRQVPRAHNVGSKWKAIGTQSKGDFDFN
jgi:hypothetical protein